MSNADDIKIIWDDDAAEGDFLVEDDDIVMDDGLETAVYLSLFLDRRAFDDDELDDPNDKRGWWGDQLNVGSLAGDQIGSRLWLLERQSTRKSVLVLAKKYCLEALEWIKEDKVAKKIEVEVERAGTKNDQLRIQIKIHKTDGNVFENTYDYQWGNQVAA